MGNVEGRNPHGSVTHHPKNIAATLAMIDKNAYRRKVMILEHCLTLARAYHDQDDTKQANYYSLLAREYFGEILELVKTPERELVT